MTPADDLCKKKMAPLRASKMKWRKVLYEKQGVPDNYVDKSFLEELQTNLNVKTYTKLYAIRETGVVTQEICSVVTFIVTFIYLENDFLQPLYLFVGSSLTVLVLYFTFKLIIFGGVNNSNGKHRTWIDDTKSAAFFLLFGFGLSPILKTLMDTVSTDTIYAMASFMMLIHLICHDYGLTSPIVSSSISLNAAIFATVCLASRLATVEGAFVLLTLSVKAFALYPVFRQHLQVSKTNFLLTAVMLLIALVSLYSVSITAALLFLSVIIFVNLICPLWFVNWQSYKENIHGPWDEAVLDFAK